MKIIILCVAYPPLKSSAAVQIEFLVRELSMQGHNVTILTPDSGIIKNYLILNDKNIKIIKIKTGKLRDISLGRRAINEFLMPFQMIFRIRKSSALLKNNNLIVWWSPSIFFSPLVIYLKILNKCPTYLILRDIFPQWTIDLGIIKSKITSFVFKFFYYLQFFFADIVGVQSEGDKVYVPSQIFGKKIYVEVLNNWNSKNLDKSNNLNNFDLSKNFLKERKIFIYAGNIGLAQDVQLLINLATKFKNNDKIGFLFIGRGTLFDKLKKFVHKNSLKNVIFHNEIPNSDLQEIYTNCFAGLVSLNFMHKTNNIPGKFISYLYSGLPVFAVVNKNNDIIELINSNLLGFATSNNNLENLKKDFLEFINKTSNDKNISLRCKKFAINNYNTKKVAKQLLSHSKNFL